jgi:amino acid permease
MHYMLVAAYRNYAVTKKTVFKWFSDVLTCKELFIWMELFILNLYLEVKWLIQHFMLKFCNIWDRPSSGKNQGNGRMVGCSIMTTFPTMCYYPSVSFWWVKMFPCHHSQPTLVACHYVTYGCFRFQRNNEREASVYDWRHHFQHDCPSAGDSKRRLPEMFPVVTRMVAQVWVPKGSTLRRINDEIGIWSFTELFDQTLY